MVHDNHQPAHGAPCDHHLASGPLVLVLWTPRPGARRLPDGHVIEDPTTETASNTGSFHAQDRPGRAGFHGEVQGRGGRGRRLDEGAAKIPAASNHTKHS